MIGEFISFKINGKVFSLFLLNTAKYTLNTIKHEFIHWIQFNFKKLFADIKLSNEIDLNLLKHLKLTEDEISYVFQESEFYPIIYDLCYRI
jgi:hypothetical protein